MSLKVKIELNPSQLKKAMEDYVNSTLGMAVDINENSISANVGVFGGTSGRHGRIFESLEMLGEIGKSDV